MPDGKWIAVAAAFMAATTGAPAVAVASASAENVSAAAAARCTVWDLPTSVPFHYEIAGLGGSGREPGASDPKTGSVIHRAPRADAIAPGTPAYRNRYSGEEGRRNAVLDPIVTDDLPAFQAAVAALIPDPFQRRHAEFKRFHLLPVLNAFSQGAGRIADQLLAWDPEALADLPQSLRDDALSSLIHHWLSVSNDEDDAGQPGDGAAPDPVIGKTHLRLMKVLLAAGAKPQAFPAGGSLALNDLAQLPPSAEAMEATRVYLRSGISINGHLPQMPTPFALAARRPNLDLVKMMTQMQQPSKLSLDQAIVMTPWVGGNPLPQVFADLGADVNSTERATLGPQYAEPDPMRVAAERLRYHHDDMPIRFAIKYRVNPNLTPAGRNYSALSLVLFDPALTLGLLDLGADPNWRDSHGNTALHRASARQADAPDAPLSVSERASLIDDLLKHHADPNAQNKEGVTPLMMVSAQDTKSVDVLLQAGASLHLPTQAAIGPLGWSLMQGKDYLAHALLIRSPQIPPEDCGAVYYAAASGSNLTLAALLERRAPVALVSPTTGFTPLLAAAERGEAGAIRLLIERGAAKITEATPRKPLPAAETAAILRSTGKLVLATGGETALMLAADEGRIDAVDELLRLGASVNQRDYTGNSALTYAQAAARLPRNDAAGVVRILLAHGAKP